MHVKEYRNSFYISKALNKIFLANCILLGITVIGTSVMEVFFSDLSHPQATVRYSNLSLESTHTETIDQH